MIVQLARQVLALLLLRRDELLRELAHLAFRLFRHRALVLGSALEDAQPDDRGQRDDQAEEQAAPESRRSSPRNAACRRVTSARWIGVVGVVELFDLRGDGEDRLAPRQHLAAQEAGALADLLDERPVEERVEGLPVVVELRLEARDPLVHSRPAVATERAQLVDRRDVVLAKLGQPLAIVGARSRSVSSR